MNLEIQSKNKIRKMQDNLTKFAEDLRNAFIEIRQMETGKKQAKTWQDVRNGL
ncbi:MAG: hypothetical protein V2I97_24125 [Desulfococcaceae bacterium]|jgi:gas vesicle protein|nr:hypothetical protein [Desulfococcaceae bacterium]